MTLNEMLKRARDKHYDSKRGTGPAHEVDYSLGYLNGVFDAKMQADNETEDRVARLAGYLHEVSARNSESTPTMADRPYWLEQARNILDP